MLCRDFTDAVELARGRASVGMFNASVAFFSVSTLSSGDVTYPWVKHNIEGRSSLTEGAVVVGGGTRLLRIGLRGSMKTAQMAQLERMPAKMRRPYFQANRSNKNRDKGPKVIEPIPVPAVTIPERRE
jgi:hypothetical protein